MSNYLIVGYVELAKVLGKSVRTAIRYAKNTNFPKPQRSVKEEISGRYANAWLRSEVQDFLDKMSSFKMTARENSDKNCQ